MYQVPKPVHIFIIFNNPTTSFIHQLMGLSLSSLLSSLFQEIFDPRILKHTFSFKNLNDAEVVTVTSESLFNTENGGVFKENTTSLMDSNRPEKMVFQRSLSFKDMLVDAEAKIRTKNGLNHMPIPTISLPQPPAFAFSPKPVSELDAAAVTLQKVYKSYRTRRNLADCAVVVEELWWRALDFVELRRNSVSFFDSEKPETAVSRWARVRNMAAKVGKGLSKDDKAQKLALQHWLEAIDPRHRYGHNLHFYYDIWFESESAQPFFYWLDVGDGKKVNLPNCPRPNLQRQCIKYLGPKERESYEVIVVLGRLMYKKSGTYVQTEEGSKWIFVLSTSRCLYVGQKKKGLFQHSSFLAGGATTAAGRLVAHDGVLEAIWPYSGHYLPTEENFREFISFLKEHNVDLTNVKRYSINDESKSFLIREDSNQENPDANSTQTSNEDVKSFTNSDSKENENVLNEQVSTGPMFDVTKRLSCKWSTGTGPRIGCVRDYPTELQFMALEQVKLSPRNGPCEFGGFGPIPSPRPSPKLRLSPRLAYMGLPSPTSAVN